MKLRALICVAVLGSGACVAPRKTVSYPVLPQTPLVSSPTVEGVAGSYANHDMMNSGYSVELRADGTYRREHYLIYCIPDPDGSFTGWTNSEEGTWNLLDRRVHLSPRKTHVENSFTQKDYFDGFRSFEARLRDTRRVLLSLDSRFPLLLEEVPIQHLRPTAASGHGSL